jgi:2-amino-4-hydroxy-6-hydroxymethyldihydropteridine diphosphokinase
MVDVYVGIGSNLEPETHLADALEQLEGRFGALKCSEVYESPPFGFAGPNFLNAVVTFASDLAPAAIEAVLTAIESTEGRAATGERGGSRTLDLDLLLYGARVDAADRLPRADVLRYPFVLAPLAELAPNLHHPVTGVALGEAWRAVALENPRLARRGSAAALAGLTSRRFGRRPRR